MNEIEKVSAFDQNIMLYLLLLVLMGVVVVLFQSCYGQKKPDKEKLRQALIDTDRAFAALAQTESYKQAFIQHAADNAVLLRPNSLPLEGKEAAEQWIQGLENNQNVITWTPRTAEVAQMVDIGYTYGTYFITGANGNKSQETPYVAIWKRQNDNTWQRIVDAEM